MPAEDGEGQTVARKGEDFALQLKRVGNSEHWDSLGLHQCCRLSFFKSYFKDFFFSQKWISVVGQSALERISLPSLSEMKPFFFFFFKGQLFKNKSE